MDRVPTPSLNDIRSRLLKISLLVGMTIVVVSGPARAQETICGTVVQDVVNGMAPLIITVTIAGGVFIGTVMHGVAGMYADPEQVRFYKKWRNRAIGGALGVIVIAYLMDTALGTVYPGWNDCIDMFPFNLGGGS
jgi:hypothetical protein